MMARKTYAECEFDLSLFGLLFFESYFLAVWCECGRRNEDIVEIGW